MKYFLILIIISSRALSVSGQNNLIDILKPCGCAFNPVHSLVYADAPMKGASFCDHRFTINSDSTFVEDGGCETHNIFFFGKWRLEGDSIALFTDANSRSQIICNIDFVKAKNHTATKTTSITVYDKKGIPVNGLLILPYTRQTRYQFWPNWIEPIDTGHSQVTNIYTDSTGTAVINLSEYDSIEFRHLTMITGRKFIFPTMDFPESIKIYLNLINPSFYDGELATIRKIDKVCFKMTKEHLSRPNWVMDVVY